VVSETSGPGLDEVLEGDTRRILDLVAAARGTGSARRQLVAAAPVAPCPSWCRAARDGRGLGSRGLRDLTQVPPPSASRPAGGRRVIHELRTRYPVGLAAETKTAHAGPRA
jgi:hypothetical protein